MTARVTKWLVALALIAVAIDDATAGCANSITQASGTKTRAGPYCPGDLIFEDNFDTLDLNVWKHEILAPGAFNGEFQQYVNTRETSYISDGKLHIHPKVTGTTADNSNVESARMVSTNGMSCKHCRVKIRAKMPGGDWTWPAIWMMPKDSVYGGWPRSGEIDITEVRGNKELYQNGQNIGSEQTGSTLHFGPDYNHNAWPHAHNRRNTAPGNGYSNDFHIYELIWTNNYLQFKVDDAVVLTVDPGSGSFWELGDFTNSGLENPWRSGGKMAPFDQQFFIILNVAIGGQFFPDDVQSPRRKPWSNSSPNPRYDFFTAKNDWLPTWLENDGHAADLIIDYIQVYAL